MSSAAVQPSAQSLANRQYQGSPHSRDQYYSQPSSGSPSAAQSSGQQPQTQTQTQTQTPQQLPVSARKASRRPSNGSTSHQSPPASAVAPSLTSPPRAMATNASPNSAPVPPPRTSSNQQQQRSHTATAPAPDMARGDENAGARIPNADEYARRRAQQESAAAAAASNNRGKPSPSHSRSATAVGQPPMGTDLPRENSTVINRVIIADPQEDVERERARASESRPMPPNGGDSASAAPVANDDGSRTRQERTEQRPARKEARFGEYYLGQTLGEGEFGKVKLGWKRDGGVQVAVKLIRRDALGTNPSRLPKIYREISILRGLQHPNIVRLHEMVETERHIGIILEYASGGELFDYILQHRFLKDNAARRLFAQLVSGVGYLHKKGIVHRDLKLENLLLDRNRNIIITDFGFANTFNPVDELGEEIEYNLSNRDFVKKMGLDVMRDDGHRRGDLMQTSCGSPCYAAPELVVSDSLYTGRKVDVWSCGVILYAMLAGYLPFDDDPANPEGDNINLLYKYIVSTPLTFPEYVTPHARDLLKRILVPDPRKRADLFEVARHSWLSEYAHVVAFITSSTTTPNDIKNTTVPSEDAFEPHLARSASVREPAKTHAPSAPTARNNPEPSSAEKAKRAANRRTVQLEYVPPSSSTARESPTASAISPPAKTRARNESQGPVEVQDTYPAARPAQQRQAPAPAAAPAAAAPSYPPSSTRPNRDAQRAASEMVNNVAQRPSTGGSMSGQRLPSGHGQPAVAVHREQATGRISQPHGKQYTVTAPSTSAGEREHEAYPAAHRSSAAYSREPSRGAGERTDSHARGHRRSNTVGGISEKLFGKTGSIFGGGGSSSKGSPPEGPLAPTEPKPKKMSHPPVSMKPMAYDPEPRRSNDSRRTSFSFARRGSAQPSERSSKRFSFLPASLTRPFTSSSSPGVDKPLPNSPIEGQMSGGRGRVIRSAGVGARDSPAQSTESGLGLQGPYGSSPAVAGPTARVLAHERTQSSSLPHLSTGYPSAAAPAPQVSQPIPERQKTRPGSRSSRQWAQAAQAHGREEFKPVYPAGFEGEYDGQGRKGATLQKTRKFTEAYDNAEGRHEGSSGAARRVMDFFRKRARARTEL
ncbi:kinase-like protein [Trichodelitschia bisporula]|uniref:non-specific serine/threonine protein kinase n=1 Tax=Trichodelitschia bisporula TaxID=703511 RepID=A0A6G1I0V0_9PEZI|nr:kinase-like protein [Trichodelitschia bisporula]